MPTISEQVYYLSTQVERLVDILEKLEERIKVIELDRAAVKAKYEERERVEADITKKADQWKMMVIKALLAALIGMVGWGLKSILDKAHLYMGRIR